MNQETSCPLHYRYHPRDLSLLGETVTDCFYIAGGLYGNPYALKKILEMADRDENQNGIKPVLMFNGDFNWLNIDNKSFRDINQTVLSHYALKGNVELELVTPSADGGCGCGYPEYIDKKIQDWSNQIIKTLRERAKKNADLTAKLNLLPKIAILKVNSLRIGVIHGDPESLSGWNLAYEEIGDISSLKKKIYSKVSRKTISKTEKIKNYFEFSKVDVFASTHTGLAFLREFSLKGKKKIIVNNGSAGMPNFSNKLSGLITRIATKPLQMNNKLYGINIDGVFIDALSIDYDQTAWLKLFQKNWPINSPASQAYYQRITCGPEHTIKEAYGAETIISL